METTRDYEYTLEVLDAEDCRVLHREPLQSTERLVDHARFQAWCAGRTDGPCAECRAVVAPAWHEEPSALLKGIIVELNVPGDGPALARTFGPRAFSRQAQAAAEGLVDRGVLQPGARYYYALSAEARPDDRPESAPSRFSATASTIAPVVDERPVRCIDPALRPQPDELFDLYIARPVIDEVIRQTRDSGADEQAGFLVGRLGRDPDTGRVYALVTAQFQALEGVEATCSSFRFSDATFLAAAGRLTLRGDPADRFLGWQHSHSWCAQCRQREECTGSTIFWSTDDQNVMESAFPSPFHVGLVAGLDWRRENNPYVCQVYGWRDGTIQERTYQLFDEGD